MAAYAVVLTGFDFGQLRTGSGDHWVSAGGLAISTLACGELSRAGMALGTFGAPHDLLRIASVVLWGLTVAWLPALIGAEALWPRPHYDVRCWATVFPLGMYSVMSLTVGHVAAAPWSGESEIGAPALL